MKKNNKPARPAFDLAADLAAHRGPVIRGIDDKIAELSRKRSTASVEDCYGINEEISILQERRRSIASST